jgi:hypothetical protein
MLTPLRRSTVNSPGGYCGVNAIPQDWIEHLALRELISEKATALFDFSNA